MMPVENISNTEFIKATDTTTTILLLLLNEDGTNYDLTDKTITARFLGAGKLLLEKQVTTDDNGYVVIRFDEGDYGYLGIGTIQAEIVVTDGADTKIFPNDGYLEFGVVYNTKSLLKDNVNVISLQTFEQSFSDMEILVNRATERANAAADRVEKLDENVSQMEGYAVRAETAADEAKTSEQLMKEWIDAYYNNAADICLPPYNAKCDGVTDETAILRQAIADHGMVKIGRPGANLAISDTVEINSSQGIVGLGRRITTITMLTDNTPILKTRGSFIKLRALKLRYKGWQNTSHPKSFGIYNSYNVGQSIYDEIEIEGAYDGIHSDNNFYSNTVSNLWINVYQNAAGYFDGTGSTGCLIQNIYTTNWTNYNIGEKRTARFGLFFKGFSENILQQINIEHTKLSYGVYFNTCLNSKVQSLHFEGYEQVGDYNGLVVASGNLTNVSVDNMTVYQCWVVDGTTQMNLFSTYGGASIEAYNVVTRGNSIVHSVQKPTSGVSTNLAYNGGGDYQDKVKLKFDNVVSQDGYFKSLANINQTQIPPQLVQYNHDKYYEQYNGKKVIYRASIPAIGTWAVGDRVINTTPSGTKGITEWLCIAAGDFASTATKPYFIAIGDGRGTTANRPTLGGDDRGFTYHDTSLNKRIWWDGTKWTDAMGATS